MRLKWLLFLVPILLATACKTAQQTPTAKAPISMKVSIQFTIEALDLSEDMSKLSTGNDELLIFIYALKDSSVLDEYLFSQHFKFDAKNRKKELYFPASETFFTNNLLFFLIEQDAETPVEQLDPIIRVHYQKLITAFENRDYIQIEKLLGDEDLLNVQVISDFSHNTPVEFNINGIHRLDKYAYTVRRE